MAGGPLLVSAMKAVLVPPNQTILPSGCSRHRQTKLSKLGPALTRELLWIITAQSSASTGDPMHISCVPCPLWGSRGNPRCRRCRSRAQTRSIT